MSFQLSYRALKKRRYSAKETYNCKEPTTRSHHIWEIWQNVFSVVIMRQFSVCVVHVCAFIASRHMYDKCLQLP